MKKFIRGFGFAFKGLGYAVKSQLNFRVHLVAAVLAVIFGIALQISPLEWEWVVLSITLVLLTELINTGIETLVDLVSPEYDEKAGHIKDISAAAVLVTALFALITGLIIFLPKLLLLAHAA